MKMKQSIKTKLSLTIAFIVLFTVLFIMLLSNILINKQFNNYIIKQQKQKMEEITASLGRQYNSSTNIWNTDYIHTIGMSALYEGYIIKVFDNQNNTVWDAQKHDMSLCAKVMDDISERMETVYPKLDGDFTSETFSLTDGYNSDNNNNNDNKIIGSVSIVYFGPYFLNDNDFNFLQTLNNILILIGILSLFLSVLIGILMSKRLSKPILKTAHVAQQISDGNYNVRINEQANTEETNILIHSFNNLAGSLEKQEMLRKQLTEDISHELRTPITVIQSHLEAMIEGMWQPTEQRLSSCNEEIKRIGGLVNELKNLSEIENNNLKLEKSEFNLKEVINSAVNSFEAKIRSKHLDVVIQGSDTLIYADKNKLTQVIVNLLSNAVKYTDESGIININLSETDDCVVFIISDNGIGIPEDDLLFIFERFYRSDKSRDRKTGGSGLGLAIVKSIIEAHNGQIKAESRLNKGSSFQINLPKNT